MSVCRKCNKEQPPELFRRRKRSDRRSWRHDGVCLECLRPGLYERSEDWSGPAKFVEMDAIFSRAMSRAIELGLETLPEVVKDERPIAFRQIHTVGQMYQQGALGSVIGE